VTRQGHEPVTSVRPTTTLARPTRTSASKAEPISSTSQACTHYPIAYHADAYYGFPAPVGPTIDFTVSQSVPNGPRSDGRGDTIQLGSGFSVLMTTPTGTIRLAPGASGDGEVIFRGFGDFNGDGRTDLIVDVVGGRYYDDTYIVGGTLSPGTYDPALVGIHIPNPAKRGEIAYFPQVVGDQNADGADDIAFGALVYSGRQLAALRPGEQLPAPMLRLPTPWVSTGFNGGVALLNIDTNAPPSFVVADPSTSSLHIQDARSDRLLLRVPRSHTPGALLRGGDVTGWLVNGQHILEYWTTTRSGTTEWRWNIDTACGS